MAGPVIHDAAFTQTSLAVLVTVALALLLQARLLAGTRSHPVSIRGRRWLAIFELYLTTTLSIVAILVGYVLLRHLATDVRPFTLGDRRTIESLLLVLLTGLALIAVVNRVVAAAWKAPELTYLEPELDGDLVFGLGFAVGLAVVVAILIAILQKHLGGAWLIILLVGLISIVAPPALSVLSLRIDRWLARYLDLDNLWKKRGHQPRLADFVLPDDLGHVTIKVFYPPTTAEAPCVSYPDAARVVRHLNGVRRHKLACNSYEAMPELHMLLTRDFSWRVAAKPKPGTGSVRSRWARRSPTGAPRGLVAWVHGEGMPPLPECREPAPDTPQEIRWNSRERKAGG